MPTTAAQSQVISGIRTSSQIFESNKVIETEEEAADESSEEENDDEFDYYDYYDDYNDVTSEREEEQFRSEPAPALPPAPPRPRFSSSTFPPPEERFADIDQEDLNNFRWRPNVIRARGYHLMIQYFTPYTLDF